ncbi:MAG: hypothetical protein C5B50_00865 [Verrucomicrobia bacterium]|nr:MAG: hypothetical protein C5B50_00865 [Verrucomicrobiota bacterium]
MSPSDADDPTAPLPDAEREGLINRLSFAAKCLEGEQRPGTASLLRAAADALARPASGWDDLITGAMIDAAEKAIRRVLNEGTPGRDPDRMHNAAYAALEAAAIARGMRKEQP